MKLARLFKLAVAAGAAFDPDGKNRNRNYSDSAVLHGDGNREIRGILVGIDIDVPELLLADRLRSRGIDCVVSHHPSGQALAGLPGVMALQVDLLTKAGLDKSSAAGFLEERRLEVERRIQPQNHARARDAARLLDIPFICVHTPADNCAAWFVERLLKRSRPSKVKDILKALLGVEEYRIAREAGNGPKLALGHPGRRAGRIFVEMTGGTEGPKEAYRLMQEAGVDTLVCMHIGEEHFKNIKKCGLNAVIAGHIPSDTLGMNLVLDAVESHEPLKILSCSGFQRVSRI